MTRARDVANLIGSGNYSSTTFTATAGQTAFTISHTQGFVQVFMNGLLLDETVDYTSNGSAVTLTSGAAAGDEIEVVAYNTFSVGDALPKSGGTMSGDLTIDTNTFHVDVADNRVGIGTTTPLRSLHVSGAGDTGLMLQTTNAVDDKEIWEIQAAGDASNHANLIMRTRVNAGTGGSEAMRINNNGVVTMPYQPAFLAVGNAGNTAYSAGAIIGILNEQFDKGNNFDTSNGRFTAPVAGAYCFNYAFFSYSSGKQFTIKKNGHDITPSDTHGIATAHTTNAMTGSSTVLYLAANDYVNVGFRSGNSGNVYVNHCHFAGFLVG